MKGTKIAALLCVLIAIVTFVGAPVAQAYAESERISDSYNAADVTPNGDSAPVKPQLEIWGAPLLNLNAQATVILKTNMMGQPNGLAVGSTITVTLENPEVVSGVGSGHQPPAQIVATGTVCADGYAALNIPDADRNALWEAVNAGGGADYTVTKSTPPMETLGIPEDFRIALKRPGAENVVGTYPELPEELKLPLAGNYAMFYVDGEPGGVLEVVDANGQTIPGSWDFAGDASVLADQPDTLEGVTEKLPVPTVLQLIQPVADDNGHTSNQLANLNVLAGVAPGIYEVTYKPTSPSYTASKLTIYVSAIWPAASVIDVGESVTLSAYAWDRQKTIKGTWQVPDNTTPATSLENTNTITLVGQYPTSTQSGNVTFETDNPDIPRLTAKVTVRGASAPVTPAIGVKDGVDLTIADNTELGKILSGPALTVTKDGHKASEVTEMCTLTPDDAGYALRIVNAEDKVLVADDVVGTGCKIELIDTGNDDKVLETVTIVVRGDVNGSGVISLTQLVRMTAGLKDASQLSPLYTLAGDLDGSGAINLTDLVQEATLYRAAISGPVSTATPAPTAEPTVDR